MDLTHEPKPDSLNVSITPGTIRIDISASALHGDQRPVIIAELRRLYKEGPRDADWVVDVSALRDLPLSFVSVLACLGEKLKSQGREMRLSGIRREDLPPGYQEALTHCVLTADEPASDDTVS